jgi:hypothetical protein
MIPFIGLFLPHISTAALPKAPGSVAAAPILGAQLLDANIRLGSWIITTS